MHISEKDRERERRGYDWDRPYDERERQSSGRESDYDRERQGQRWGRSDDDWERRGFGREQGSSWNQRSYGKELGQERERQGQGWERSDNDWERRGQDWGQSDDNWRFQSQGRDRGYGWERQAGDWRQSGQEPERQGYGWGQQAYGREQPSYNREQSYNRRQDYPWGQQGQEGYFGGQYAGRGPKGYQRSDERIREDVCERLTQHPAIDAGEIEVEVKNCEVTLKGTVENRQCKRMAEEIAELSSGVKEVHNQLRVTQNQQNSQSQTAQSGLKGRTAS